MKILTISCLLAFLSACSSLPTGEKKPETKKITSPAGEKSVAVWSLLSYPRLTLYLKNIDNAKVLILHLDKGISERKVPPGHWEITGFEIEGKTFYANQAFKKFIFHMQDKVDVYAGSIIVECPSVSSGHFKDLKRMKFFNRYSFSSTAQLCEMVIGNDFAEVKMELQKTRKFKKLNIIMGL